MKKIFLFVSPLIFLVACSGGGGDTQPEIPGCMDDCALNYNPNATVADQCIYSFLGTYSIDEYTIDGISIFNQVLMPYCTDATVTFTNDGTYEVIFIYSDGSSLLSTGTFTNTMTALTLYPSDGSGSETYELMKINCLEFDGAGLVDGSNIYIETSFIGESIVGCMDDCALNYNPYATISDVCIYSFLGTYQVSEFTLDGYSLFDDIWSTGNYLIDALVAFGLDAAGNGIYVMAYYYADGTELVESGTFVNSLTQLIFYPSDGSNPTLWNTTKINCLEFDGNTMVDGIFYEIELTYVSPKLDNLEKNPTSLKFDPTQFKRKK